MSNTTTDTLTIEQRKARAYNRAFRALREEFAKEWQAHLAQEYKTEGLEYTPRLSPEDKARQQITALLEEFPDLRGETLV